MADAGQRRVDEDEARDHVRMFPRQGVADHIADVMGDQIRMFDPQRIQHADDVGALVSLS